MSPLDVIALPGHPGMFARRVAVEAWQSAGSPHVDSAGRLYAEQKHFYDGWREHLPGFNPADNPDDESQRLAHVRFVAFDIDPTADRIKRLTAAGFIRPYTYEPWHWELPNVRSYELVRSIPATASLDITAITNQQEDDMKIIYDSAAGGGVYLADTGHDLVHIENTVDLAILQRVVAPTDSRFSMAELQRIKYYMLKFAPASDTDLLRSTVTSALAGLKVTADTSAIARAVDAALADNFAALPGQVVKATAAQYAK